jgi:CheY-like chemotaxis protein
MDPALSNKLVLLVEDEELLLRGMQAWLRDNELGYAVMTAANGQQALDLVERYQPDLVISDLRLPGMDGLELLLACRKRFAQMRFVVMSAYGTPDLEERSLRSGAVRFLHKPVDMVQLEATIAEVLGQNPQEERAGFLSGVSIPGFVQLLSMERKSVRLHLRREGQPDGALHLADGALIHARCGPLEGESAALALLAWDDAEMWLEAGERTCPRTISKALPGLILDALRLRDEQRR